MGNSRAGVASGPVGASASTHRFWDAVTATDDDRGESTALVIQRLAELGHEDDLLDVLRPDRNRDDVTLTVVCYEVGSITPSAIHEATSACEAIALVSACTDPHHIASELVASNDDGMRWVAMVRADHRIQFRPPAEDNTSGPDHAVQVALIRWQRESIFQRSLYDDGLGDAPTYPTSGGEPDPVRTVFRTPEIPGAGSDLDSGPVPVARNGNSTARVNAPRAGGPATTKSQGPQPPAETAITNRTLQSTVRSAVAEVVPNLQRYLGDQVAALIAQQPAPTADSSGEIMQALAGLREEMRWFGAELERSMQAQVQVLQSEIQTLRAELDKQAAVQAERTVHMSEALRSHILQLRDATVESRFDEVRTLVQDVARRLP